MVFLARYGASTGALLRGGDAGLPPETLAMSWRRVAVIYVVLAVLASYLIIFERTEGPSEQVDPGSAASSLLGVDASSVTSVTFRKEGKIVRAIREDGRWRAVEPPGSQVSPDLFEATIATLTAGQASERLSREPENALAAYGLDAPSATLEVVTSDAPGRPITVLIGARNTTRTAVYARRSDQTSVFLVGMNLSYYIDLIFDAVQT
jgi:hypothetical protein